VRAVNISQTGACLSLKVAVAVKDEVEVIFEAPGVSATKRLGNITWVRPADDGTFLVGVDFQKDLSFQEVQGLTRSS
jgi:hypothetical protein